LEKGSVEIGGGNGALRRRQIRGRKVGGVENVVMKLIN
jgi:hypothetical protein